MVLIPYSYLTADYERKVFNVSACVWNEGADENIVTILSKDSDSATSGGGDGGSGGGGGSSSSKRAHLGGGAIAGIVVGCIAAVLIVAGIAAFVILRKRRKWMRRGYAVAAPKPAPDESVLKGPVFNSNPHSTDHSTPFSAADVSAPRSTAEYSRSTADSPARPFAVAAGAGGGSTPELDGHDTHVRPNAELDGREVNGLGQEPHPTARNPGVYELPGSEVAGGNERPAEPNREISTVGDLPSFGEREPVDGSPPSPYVSTLGTNSAVDEREHNGLVSPTTPVQHGRRLF